MNGWTWIVFIAAAILLILAILSCSANAAGVTISDGDTIIWNGERIRLYGIDAPEKDQPYGPEARAALAAMVAQAGTELRIMRKDKDIYGRTIAIIYDGRKSINKAMVEGGHAWAYIRYSTAYEADEERSRAARRGLWAMPCPIAPWQYRNG